MPGGRGGGASISSRQRGAKTSARMARASKRAARKRGAGGKGVSAARGKSKKKY